MNSSNFYEDEKSTVFPSCLYHVTGDDYFTVPGDKYIDGWNRDILDLWLIYVTLTLICIMGLLTNAMNISFLQLSIKKTFYTALLCTAVCNLMTVAVVLGDNFVQVMNEKTTLVTGWYMYWWAVGYSLLYLTSSVYNWCLILLTVIRVLTFLFPSQVSTLVSRKRVITAITCITIGSLIVILFRIILMFTCAAKHYMLTTSVMVIVTGVLPWILCLLSVVILVIILVKSRRQSSPMQNEAHNEIQLTITTIIVISSYVLLNLPNVLYEFAVLTRHQSMRFAMLIAYQKSAHVLHITTYAINFFIYMGNSAMRNLFLNLVRSEHQSMHKTVETAESLM